MRRLPLIVLLALLLAPACALAGRGACTTPTFVIEGRGWGHGVGMSQYGAEGFANHGWTYPQILAHYYSGTRVERRRPRSVRVLLADGRARVVVSSPVAFTVGDGRRTVELPRGRYAVGPGLGIGLHHRPLPLHGRLRFEPGTQPLALDGDGYRGSLVLFRTGGGLGVVDDVSLEEYLRGVVPYEMPYFWRPQALRAQAVAARSYALATLHPGESYDLLPDTRDQVYGGVHAERPTTSAAVAATAGQVVTWQRRVALTYYFSTSGGRTASAADVLPDAPDVPYLRAVADPYDAISPHHTWGPIRLSARALARRLGLHCAVDDVALVANSSGRVAELEAACGTRVARVSGGAVRAALGLQSTWFDVSLDRGRLPELDAQGVPVPPDASAPAAPSPYAWPARRHAYTIVLESLPESVGERAARTKADEARRAGLQAGVLRSSDFSNLAPGYYVVFSGVYKTGAEAQQAVAQAGRGYPREIVP